MAIRSSSEIQPARVIATIWVIITLACAVIIGMLGSLYISSGHAAAELAAMANGDPEKIFMVLIQSIFGMSGSIIGAISVSYTHLDVYKRQILVRYRNSGCVRQGSEKGG